VVEPAGVLERGLQRILAGVTEGWVAEVVGQAQRLGEVLVEAERASDGPADLRDFEAVGEANAEMVTVGRNEHLRLVAESPEGDRVNDAVAVALEDVAGAARARLGFRMKPATRMLRMSR
jgi:hypothetical protein